MFFGNLFVFIKFQGKTHIDLETRNVVFGVLTGVCAAGIVFLVLLRPVRRAPAIDEAKVSFRKSLQCGIDRPGADITPYVHTIMIRLPR